MGGAYFLRVTEQRLGAMADRVRLAVLVLVAVLTLSHAILEGGSTRNARHTKQLVKRHKSDPFLPSAALRAKLSAARPFTHPSTLIRDRHARSPGNQETCGMKQSSLLETDPVSQYILYHCSSTHQ